MSAFRASIPCFDSKDSRSSRLRRRAQMTVVALPDVLAGISASGAPGLPGFGGHRIPGPAEGGMLAAEFTVPCGSIQLEFVPKDD